MKDGWLRKLWRIIWRTPVRFNQHNCPVMAAGMSFFGILSLVPLTLLAVSLLGYILGSSGDAQQFVSKLLFENFPKSAKEMLSQVNRIIASPERTLVNGLSLLGLMWSGMRFFNILQRVLNTIWVGATQRRFLRGRIVAFGIFVVAGLLFWISFVLTSLMVTARELDLAFRGVKLSDIHRFWLTVEFATPLVASTIVLFLVYLFVPHARVSSRAASIGATFAAIFLQLSRWLFSFVMAKFDVYGRVYGPLASFIVFMSWLYLSMTIVLMGAELGSQVQEVFLSTGETGSDAKSR